MGREEIQKLESGELQILAATEGDKRRRFRMLAYSGAPVERMFGRAVFDLAGIEIAKKTPILADHDLALRAGFSDRHEMTAEGLVLEGFLLSNEVGERLASESDEGFPFQASVGLRVSQWLEIESGETHRVNGMDVPGPVSVAVTSRLVESSFLTYGADRTTHAVALAAQSEERIMKPEAFEAANPEAVAAWKDAAADVARLEQREALGEYLAAFPDRLEFAVAKFRLGETLLEARAALSDVLLEELAAAKAAPPAKPDADAATLAKLAAKAPGVGFDGARQGDPTKPTAETLWQNPTIQGEFGGSRAAFLQAIGHGLIEELN